jgi:hypothetical protein
LLTLDTATTTKVFDKVKIILGQVRGVTGMPLVYVIRVALILEEEKDDPPFGDKDTKYTSIDMEMMARAPLLSDKADIYKDDPKNLKVYGPFVPTFSTDAKKVWAIILACFGLSSRWQHVMKFASQQNGSQAWRTLHDHIFGGDKVNTMVADILLTLKSLHYSGNWSPVPGRSCKGGLPPQRRYKGTADVNLGKRRNMKKTTKKTSGKMK